jgi:hypothetical protein
MTLTADPLLSPSTVFMSHKEKITPASLKINSLTGNKN